MTGVPFWLLAVLYSVWRRPSLFETELRNLKKKTHQPVVWTKENQPKDFPGVNTSLFSKSDVPKLTHCWERVATDVKQCEYINRRQTETPWEHLPSGGFTLLDFLVRGLLARTTFRVFCWSAETQSTSETDIFLWREKPPPHPPKSWQILLKWIEKCRLDSGGGIG